MAAGAAVNRVWMSSSLLLDTEAAATADQLIASSLRITWETLQHEAHRGRRFLLFIGGDNIL